MRTSVRQLAYDLADVFTDLIAKGEGANEACAKVGSAPTAYAGEAYHGAAMAAEVHAKEQAWARDAEPGPAMFNDDYARQLAERRTFARQRAVEMALGAYGSFNRVVGEGERVEVPTDDVLRLAANIADFIEHGLVRLAPTLEDFGTDDLIRELSRRTS